MYNEYVCIARDYDNLDVFRLLLTEDLDYEPIAYFNKHGKRLKITEFHQILDRKGREYKSRMIGYLYKHHIGDGWFSCKQEEIDKAFSNNDWFYKEFEKKTVRVKNNA